MAAYKIICPRCGRELKEEPVYKCLGCRNIVEFYYDFMPSRYERRDAEPGIFKYADVLPLIDSSSNISLGEGDTPLIASTSIRKEEELENILFKLEYMNPTGSFKDRAMAVLMSKASELGLNKAIIASSGNAAASAAAYAARCGMELIAVVPETTPDGKTGQILAHGGKIVKVAGLFSESYALCEELAKRNGWLNLTTTFLNPYAREGYKTIGYEIFEQLGGSAPDFILIPTGDGPLLASMYEAFEELHQQGLVTQMPHLVSVQAANCDPINESFRSGIPCRELNEGWKPTIASGIDDNLAGYEDDGDYTVGIIRKSGGMAISLDEEEIYRSVLKLAQEGVYAEPAGAVCAIALHELNQQGFFKKNDVIVCLVTGSGLKNSVEVDRKTMSVARNVHDAEKEIWEWR